MWIALTALLLELPAPARDLRLPAGTGHTLTLAPPARITIPAGPFRMGSTAQDLQNARRMCADELRDGGALLSELSPRCGSRFDNEAPQVEVFVPAFSLDRTEVTVAAYAACVPAGGCRPSPGPALAGGKPDWPVEAVTWFEAATYCRWRGGRLPTEAEWEKAARGLGGRGWPWGDAWRPGRANHGRSPRGVATHAFAHEDAGSSIDGHAGRSPVGVFANGRSPHGLVDMAGNVWEWTSDAFGREPPQATETFAPRGPPHADERTLRGGGYLSPPSDLRVSRRVGMSPGERSAAVGFRCAYDVPRRRGALTPTLPDAAVQPWLLGREPR